MSAWLCAAAHISADCPPQVSLALMSAPASSSALAASTLPLRAAAISGVSPLGVLKLGSAPALSSASMIGAEPMIAASVMAEVPSWFYSLTFAPALISARTSSRSPFAAAYMMAVLPSASVGVYVRALGAHQTHGRGVVAGFRRVQQRALGRRIGRHAIPDAARRRPAGAANGEPRTCACAKPPKDRRRRRRWISPGSHCAAAA